MNIDSKCLTQVLKDHRDNIARFRSFFGDTDDEWMRARGDDATAQATEVLRRAVASRWEIHFMLAFKSTIKNPKKRHPRVQSLNTWWTQNDGRIDMVVPELWKQAQAILAAGAKP